jgi:hypothetical protein
VILRGRVGTHQAPHDAAAISRGRYALCAVLVDLQSIHRSSVLREGRYESLKGRGAMEEEWDRKAMNEGEFKGWWW